MRNQYPGICYRCGTNVEAGDGHFERLAGRWRVQHADCAIKFRGQADEERATATLNKRTLTINRLRVQAAGTGRQAQKARRRLKDFQITNN